MGCYGQCGNASVTVAECDGATIGTCDETSTTCPASLTCGTAESCRSFCTADSHCTVARYCSGGACFQQVPVGQDCSTDNQCLTRICGFGSPRKCVNCTSNRHCQKSAARLPEHLYGRVRRLRGVDVSWELPMYGGRWGSTWTTPLAHASAAMTLSAVTRVRLVVICLMASAAVGPAASCAFKAWLAPTPQSAGSARSPPDSRAPPAPSARPGSVMARRGCVSRRGNRGILRAKRGQATFSRPTPGSRKSSLYPFFYSAEQLEQIVAGEAAVAAAAVAQRGLEQRALLVLQPRIRSSTVPWETRR